MDRHNGIIADIAKELWLEGLGVFYDLTKWTRITWLSESNLEDEEEIYSLSLRSAGETHIQRVNRRHTVFKNVNARFSVYQG